VLGIAAGYVIAAAQLPDCEATGADTDAPAGIAEEVLALVDQRPAVTTIPHITARFPTETAGAGVQAGIEAVALTATDGQAAALVDTVQIHLPAATLGICPRRGRRHQKRHCHKTQLQQTARHDRSPY